MTRNYPDLGRIVTLIALAVSVTLSALLVVATTLWS
jgi:hypothetical protein